MSTMECNQSMEATNSDTLSSNNCSTSESEKTQDAPKKFEFLDLLNELRTIFKEDRVDIDYVKKVIASYNSEAKDWRKYAHFDRFR